MSAPARLIRVVVAALTVIGIGLAGWLLVGESAAPARVAERPLDAQAATEAPVPAEAAPTAAPTATSEPTPTPLPTPVPFTDALELGPLVDELASPLPGCGLARADGPAGTVALSCVAGTGREPVLAAASGRVVHVVREPALAVAVEAGPDGQWAWGRQAGLGTHVVIDHGTLGGSANSQTVYAGLSEVSPDIAVGRAIELGDPVGAITGQDPTLLFSAWANNARQDGARVLLPGPDLEQQRQVAQSLSDQIVAPTDPRCPLVLSPSQLPGALRDYRNGVHQGIDFGCGAEDRSAFAIAAGTVVYLVDDYVDPTVEEREALLQNAGLAGFTPHWTLVMLYGNVVVIDHGEMPGVGRVVTVAAHLEAVDPAVTLGAKVEPGQRLGELGNRGTNASALGLRGSQDPSLHLHWELFIDGWFLGSGLDAAGVTEVIRTALCGAAATSGCPV